MMIARLRGTVEQIGFDRGDSMNVLIDVNGVGYLAQVSSRTRARLPLSGRDRDAAGRDAGARGTPSFFTASSIPPSGTGFGR